MNFLFFPPLKHFTLKIRNLKGEGLSQRKEEKLLKTIVNDDEKYLSRNNETTRKFLKNQDFC